MLPRTCPACRHKSVSYDEGYAFCTDCPLYRKPLGRLQRVLAWASSRAWWWRLPILIWFAVMFVDNLQNPSYALSRLSNPFSALDFGMHELGHMLFEPFGRFMHILGGSLFQCLFPILWLIGFLQKRWFFAAAMCFCWLGLNLFDVAGYAADAQARLMPLSIGPGVFAVNPMEMDQVYDQAHDWYQILSRTDMLEHDQEIAQGLRVAGGGFFVLGLGLGAVLILQMFSGWLWRLRHRKN